MTVTEKAYAKINLFLDVTGRREDGYHNIRTLMQSVSLCDEITVTATPSDSILINILSNENSLEHNENNLVYKSALKYLSHFKINARLDVELIKRIPIGAGLGGGSSDAAATLRILNKIYGFATYDRLYEMASELGSDVPFCLCGGAAVCTGRGEIVCSRKIKFYPYLVIAIGESRISTPKAYALLDRKYGDFTEYKGRNRFFDIETDSYYNIFEKVIEPKEITGIKKIMTECGAKSTLMSGSGPSVWGGFDDEACASLAKLELEKRGYFSVDCNPI